MVELEHKLAEPTELKKFRQKNPGSKWDDEHFFPVKEIIRSQLERDQGGCCVYCEMLLTDKKHIEHIKPRTANPHLTFKYSNLAVSCTSNKHCGNKKGKSELPVSPRPGCNQYFSLSVQDGAIMPDNNQDDCNKAKAKKTIEILGLNCPKLMQLRKCYIDIITTFDEPVTKQDFSDFLISLPFIPI
jgi:uncharacterized protein (TIGR02646 family)